MNTKHGTTILFVLLALVGVAVGSALAPQDALTLDAENPTVTPGNTATVTVSVTNTGNESLGGNYTLSANASTVPAGWQATPANGTVVRGPLEPNETRTTTLSVSVPENATPGDYMLALALTAGDHEWANTTVTVSVTDESPTTTESSESSRDDDSADRAMETTTETNSTDGGAVVVSGDGPSHPSWWPFDAVSPTQAFGVLLAIAGLYVVANRLSES